MVITLSEEDYERLLTVVYIATSWALQLEVTTMIEHTNRLCELFADVDYSEDE